MLPVPVPSIDTTNLIDEFLRGRTQQTLRAYEQDMSSFTEFLQVSDSREAARILLSQDAGKANQIILSYRNSLKESGLQHSSINRRLSTLRSLVKLARMLGLCNWSIEIQNLKHTKTKDTRGPRETGFQKLQTQVQYRTDPKGVRDNAMLLLLHDLGLRRNEVCSLDYEDVDLENLSLRVLGKGRDQKESLTLPARTADALAQWILLRGSHSGPLFTNLHRSESIAGTRLTGTSLYRIIQRVGLDTGQKVTPHGIRHTSITTAVERVGQEGIDITKVLKFSRHKSLQALQPYVDSYDDWQGKIAGFVAR